MKNGCAGWPRITSNFTFRWSSRPRLAQRPLKGRAAMSRFSSRLESDQFLFILFRKSGQHVARSGGHRTPSKIAAFRGVVTEAIERLLFHEVATQLL